MQLEIAQKDLSNKCSNKIKEANEITNKIEDNIEAENAETKDLIKQLRETLNEVQELHNISVKQIEGRWEESKSHQNDTRNMK